MRITAPAKTEIRQDQPFTSDKKSTSGGESADVFIDRRPKAIALRQLQAISENSQKSRQQTILIQMAQAGSLPPQSKDGTAGMNGSVLQKDEDENAEETGSRSEQSDDSGPLLEAMQTQRQVKPTLQMKGRDDTMQLKPFKPKEAAKTIKATEDPNTWTKMNAYSLISSAATYPTAVRTKTRDADGGGSDTSGLQPTGMEKWYQKGLLQDPSIVGKTQALTKMHAINSHLHGPNHEANIFLGSANANAQHSDEVEEPIKRYVSKAGRAVDYHVAITYGNPGWVNGPQYANLTGTEKKQFDTWQSQAIAHQVTCTATYFEEKAGVWLKSAPESHVINALTTTHQKVGGYGKPKNRKAQWATKRSLAKTRRTALFGAVKEALNGKKKGFTLAETSGYIGIKKPGKWKNKGISNMLEYMRNQGLVAMIDGKYVASKKL